MWLACAAQPRMASNAPDEVPGDAAREGTCAAWVAEMVLTGAAVDAAALVDTAHENGWIVTADMAAHVQPYVDKLRSYGGDIHVERKVILNRHVKGTPDGFSVMDKEGILRVKDLKYGFLVVEPYRNPQVSIYAGAILRYLAARDVKITRVEISIYQPRAWHPLGIDRVWVIHPTELMEFVHEIEAASEGCQNPSALATPGDHCYYCPAAPTCAASAHEAYRIHSHVVEGTQRHMTAEELTKELAFLDMAEEMITGRKKAVFAEAESRVTRGEHLPGWHMQRGSGQRRWKVSPDVVEAITGIDIKKVATITPAEAERMKVHPELLKTLTETPQLTPKLRRIPPGFYSQLFKMRKT
jgi:hypothetical protein